MCLPWHHVIVNQLFKECVNLDRKFIIVIQYNYPLKIVHCIISVQKQDRRKSRETWVEFLPRGAKVLTSAKINLTFPESLIRHKKTGVIFP